MRAILAIITISLLGFKASADEGFIVKLKANENPVTFAIQNNVVLEPISEEVGLYLATSGSVSRLMNTRNKIRGLEYAQNNHTVELRGNTKPSDHNFGRQWNMLSHSTNGIDAISAWAEYGTGGTDAMGREIVVAVVDAGFDYNHPDLIENAWVNKNEIPNNGRDDDGNGYIDDIYGWSANNNSGKISSDDHGTHVAGIIGAKGDNGEFVAGVNWNIKMMYVSAGWSLGDTATVLRAYGYILKQKQLWISSGGKLGANIVAVNSSFGVNRADCNNWEYTAWNDMFNALGKVGVLSIGATANENWDIDRVGDVPTSCNSDFVVAVTNTQNYGEKVRYAGYGVRTIDLAAPGEEIYSTTPYKTASSMSGTSMATPHVTGAVGYLYSVASPAFINASIKDPARAALEMKKVLMSTVTKRQKLSEQTVSGGILNLMGASEIMSQHSGF